MPNLKLPRIKTSLAQCYPSLLHALLVVFLMGWSWQRWISVETDGGWSLYTFWRVSEGQVLYRDILSALGPFSVYFCAFLFRLLGVSLRSLALFDAFLIWLMAQMIFRIFSWIGNQIEGMAISCCFLVLFAFSQYTIAANYNFVTPYKLEALHGTFFFLSLVYFLVSYIAKERSFSLLLAGICCGAGLTTAAEGAGAACLASLLWMGALVLYEKRRSRFHKLALLFLVGVAVVPSGFLLFLWRFQKFSLSDAIVHTFGAELAPFQQARVMNIPLYQDLLGTNALGKNIVLLLASSASYIFAAFVALALARATKQFSRNARAGLGVILLLAAYAFIYLPFLRTPPLVPSPAWEFLLRGLPIFDLAAFFFSFYVAVWTRGKEPPRALRARGKILVAGIWAAVAFFLVLRIALHVQIPRYGFYLTMPSFLLLAFTFVSALPRWLSGKGWNGQTPQILFSGILLAMVLVHFEESSAIYRLKNVPVGRGGDTIWGLDPEVAPDDTAIGKVVDWVNQNTPPFANVVVLPEGLMINYLTRRAHIGQTTMSYLAYLHLGEEAIMKPWRENPPDFVVSLPRDTSEFGVPPFGAAGVYGLATMNWVHQNYQRVFGELGAEIYQRRDLAR